jgi:hypothetical protein
VRPTDYDALVILGGGITSDSAFNPRQIALVFGQLLNRLHAQRVLLLIGQPDAGGAAFYRLGVDAHLVVAVDAAQLDLCVVDLAPVAQACYDYWHEVGDMDEAADALATLAYLAERKAQRLLAPDLEPEPDRRGGVARAHAPARPVPALGRASAPARGQADAALFSQRRRGRPPRLRTAARIRRGAARPSSGSPSNTCWNSACPSLTPSRTDATSRCTRG